MIDAAALRTRFTAIAGHGPQGLWAGPGRVNLIGEHTDYNDGFVLPFALEKKAVVAASRRDDDLIVVHSMELDEQVEVRLTDLAPGTPGWASYLVGCVWALIQAGYPLSGLNLVLTSDVPLGAGLSSSAAIECATVAALVDLFDLDIAPMDRAKLARVAENAYVGAPTGLLDQAASTLCRAGEALFLDCRNDDFKQIPLPLASLGLEILVLDTNTPHSHVDGEYADRRHSCEEAARALGVPALRDVDDLDAALAKLSDETLIKRVRHVVTENARVLEAVALAEQGRVAELAPLLDASHLSMRDDYEITVPTIDLAVEVARDAGALGARMTGGGFGGCIIALCPAGEGERIGSEIATAFRLAEFAAPQWFVGTPGPGAGKVE